MAKSSPVTRHLKSTEFEIVSASRQAELGWRDLRATQRNVLADAWDYLTTTPTHPTPTAHPLRGTLAIVRHQGIDHERWQYELSGGARIWYFVVDQTVYLEHVHTRHPNETK